MAYDYQSDWSRRLRDEFGGDRHALLEALQNEYATGYTGVEGDMPYLSGINAEEIGKFFVDPRLAEARRNFDRSLRSGYQRALKGAGHRMTGRSARVGIPQTGAATRMEGTIGRPEGLAASSGFAKKRQEHEEALMSDPNVYAPIAGFGASLRDAHAKHAGHAGAMSKGMGVGAGVMAILSSIPGLNAIAAPIAAGLAAGSSGTQLATDELGRRTEKHASKFNPGLWQAGKKTYSDPGAGMGLDYKPFGANQTALGGLYGRPEKRDDEEDYLFGSLT